MCSDQRLLKINCINGSNTKQRAVLERVGGEGVVGAVPQTSAADLHALIAQLANVDQNHKFISGNHEILHTSSYHLEDTVAKFSHRNRKWRRCKIVQLPEMCLPRWLFLSFSGTTPFRTSLLEGKWWVHPWGFLSLQKLGCVWRVLQEKKILIKVF